MDLPWHAVPRCCPRTFLKGNGVSSFTTDPKLTPLADGRNWRVEEDFKYDLGKEGSGLSITVKRGAITDFASVPRFLWIIFPPWGWYGKAVIIHDWLYRSQMLSRAIADAILLDGMYVLSGPRWQRWCIYWGVKCFGWWAYYIKRAPVDVVSGPVVLKATGVRVDSDTVIVTDENNVTATK